MFEDNKFKQLEQRVEALEVKPGMPDHQHNGFDASRVVWGDVARRRFSVSYTIPGTSAASALNYGPFFTAYTPCTVIGFTEVHTTPGSEAVAVPFIMLEKLTGTTAPGSGLDLLTEELSLKNPANTVQHGTITNVSKNRTFNIDDRLAVKNTGSLTDLFHVTVTVELQLI